LNILSHPSLRNLDGLSSLSSVGGTMAIALNSLDNLEGLSSLTSVGRTLSISNETSLRDVNGLRSVTTVGHKLTILYNSRLEQLDGLSSIAAVGSSLSIAENSRLSDCCGLYELLASGTLTNNIMIGSNAAGCNSPEEVLTGGPCRAVPTLPSWAVFSALCLLLLLGAAAIGSRTHRRQAS